MDQNSKTPGICCSRENIWLLFTVMADTLTAKLQPTNVPQTSPKLPARNLQVQCLQLDEAWLWKKGLMMWWILVLKVFLSQYFYVPEDLISRENCNRRCGAPGSCWKGASQPHRATLVHTSINPEPSCSSPGTFSWPWLLQSKTKLRKEGKLTRELAVLTTAVVEQIIPNTCIAETRNRPAFDLGTLV